MPKLIREFRITNTDEIDDVLTECCAQLACLKVNDKGNIASIIAENKAKISQRLSRLRGKKINTKEELDNFKLNKSESIAKIASKFMADMKKDLWKGESYRFRDISIPEKVNSKNGEYLELSFKNGTLYFQVFKP